MPVLLETSSNHERLSFLAGEVGNDPLKPYMQTDAILIEAAKLLSKFHDLTQHFVAAPDALYQLPIRIDLSHEVICHNDFAPYNCVFKDEHLVRIIDFDTAAPGTRLGDIAYAVYRFVPLANDSHAHYLGWTPIPNRLSRLKLFCDVYGLVDKNGLISTLQKRLEAMVDHMRQTSSNLEHIPLYLEDLAYIAANQSRFDEALSH